MPGCKPLTSIDAADLRPPSFPLLAAGGAPRRRPGDVVGRVRHRNLLANRLPTRAPGLARRFPAGRPTARRRPKGAQWDAPGTVVFLDTPAGSLTYDLGAVRSVSAFVLQADANDSYKIFGAARGQPVGVQAARRGRQRRQRRPRPAHAPGADPADCGALRAHRRAAGRQLLLDLRVPGLLHAAEPVPAQAADRRRARGRRWSQAPWCEVLVVRQRRERALRDGAGVRGAGRCWPGGCGSTSRGGRGISARLRDGLLLFLGVVSFSCYFNFGLWHFRNYVHQWDTFHYYVGLEVLQRAVVRPPVRMRRGR